MEEILHRLWRDLLERPDGPMAFRFYLQPFMAILFGVRSGRADAKAGKPPYILTILREPSLRKELLLDGARSIAKILILATVLDTAYQLIVLKSFYPLETLIIVFVLAAFPYAATRGLTNRLSVRRTGSR